MFTFNSIADLTKLPALLQQRGYTDADVRGIMSGNFTRALFKAFVPSSEISPAGVCQVAQPL